MSAAHLITVAPGDGAQRLDRWLRRHFPHLTQGAIEKMCRKGEVRVNGGRVTSATRVEDGQAVRIPPLGAQSSQPAPLVVRDGIAKADEEMIQAAVLWKDDHIIALNKPPGLPSQGGSGQGNRHVDALAEALMFGFKDKPKLVHRLDRDTSGLMLLARTDRIARTLSEALRHRAVRKVYWAAVAGVPLPKRGTIRYGLVKAGGGPRGDEKMRCIHPDAVTATDGAKRATTDYMVVEALARRASWLAMVPVTGRTHQLRAHIAELGHPILGDGKYGGSGQENLGDGWGAGIGGDLSKKLHLHARFLQFEHPITRMLVNLTAPLPAHMAATWNFVGWSEAEALADPFNPPT